MELTIVDGLGCSTSKPLPAGSASRSLPCHPFASQVQILSLPKRGNFDIPTDVVGIVFVAANVDPSDVVVVIFSFL